MDFSTLKKTVLLSLTAADIPFEEAVLRDPYGVRTWQRYTEHKLDFVGRVPDSHVVVVFERAVHALPGSYKLWKRYLDWSMQRLAQRDGPEAAQHREVAFVAGAYQRALLTLHKMPRLWTDHLALLTTRCAHKVSEIRRRFDEALRALPPSQHERVWELFLPWADSVGGLVAAHVHARFARPDTARLPGYIRVLAALGDHRSAARHLEHSIAASTAEGLPTFDQFARLAEIVVEHPEAVDMRTAERALRAALRHYPKHSAKFWLALARFWVLRGRLERARDVFEEAVHTVATVRDFGVVFDAYVEYLETVATQQMRIAEERQGKADDHGDNSAMESSRHLLDVDLLLHRLDHLISERATLVNEVQLRQNPHAVLDWLARVKLVADKSAEDASEDSDTRRARVQATYRQAVHTVSARQATGALDALWIAYANHRAQEVGDVEGASAIFEEAVQVNYKTVGALASVWMAYAKMHLDLGNFRQALMLIGRATVVPKNTAVDCKDKKITPQRRLFRSLTIWQYYADLQEVFGSESSVRAVYDTILRLKIATPQVVVNYALYLESRDYFEDSFKIYERGIELFGWPAAFELWNVYIPKFLHRHGRGTKIERAREMFEMALSGCPQELCKTLYLQYGRVEEDQGLCRRAMRIYERAARAVAPRERLDVYMYYAARAVAYFGLVAAREIYERALAQLPDRHAASLCQDFAHLELRLGEVERARAVLAHGSQFCDPRLDGAYWRAWQDFEVKYGNEDTFKEMLRIRRSVQAQYNTELNFIAAQLTAARAKQQQQQQQKQQKQQQEDEEHDRQELQQDALAVEDALVAQAGAHRGLGGAVVAERPVPAGVYGRAVDARR